ncbi:MAG: TolC family protein [Thermodesulfobacteriota bacterium]|nr:TolC family protein [Thermodesulfobacteriota bacterium]
MNNLKTCILTFFLVVFLSFESGADEFVMDTQQAIPQMNVNSNHDRKSSNTSEIIKIGLEDFIKLVKEKNERIIVQQLEWEITGDAIKNAKSIFEPEVVGSYEHERSKAKYSKEEAVSFFGSASDRDEQNNNYNAAIEGLIPTGGRISLGYTLQELSNNFNKGDEEYQTFIGASLTQPLLKNAGLKTTMANIHIAETDYDIALHTYRRQMMQVVSNAVAAYWNLYLAQEKYRMRQDSVTIAEQVLRDNRERVKTGKMAKTEVMEAEAGLLLRKSLEIEAKQDIVAAMNDLYIYISSSVGDKEMEIELTDRIEVDTMERDLKMSLQNAFRLRPDYIETRKKIEREKIRVAFAKNQRWPQLDLKGSYGLNGLEDSVGNSWDKALERDFESWTVGVELRIPITGGMKTRSELAAAIRRKKQALLELKAVEVGMINGINTAYKKVCSACEQAAYYGSVVDINKHLLEVELARLDAGKSNSRYVLEKEEDLNRVKEAKIESLVMYEKAILELEMAEGSILVCYNIEVMEVDK